MTTQNFGQIKSNNSDITYNDVSQVWTFSAIHVGAGIVDSSFVLCVNSATAASQVYVSAVAPAVTLGNHATVASATNTANVGLATTAHDFITGSAPGDMFIGTKGIGGGTPGAILFGRNTTEDMRLNSVGLKLANHVSTKTHVNVRHYGALGTGTDDTVAFQAALTAIGSTPSVLVIPAGTYLLQSLTIAAATPSLEICGIAGGGSGAASRLVHNDTDPLFTHASASPVRISFRNLEITQSDATAGDVISFAGSISGITFENMFVVMSNPASSTVVLATNPSFITFREFFAYQAAAASAPLIDISSTHPNNVFGISIENSGLWGTETSTAPLVKIDSGDTVYGGWGPSIRNLYCHVPKGGCVHLYSMRDGTFTDVWAGDTSGATAPGILLTHTAGGAIESDGHVFTGCSIACGQVSQPDISHTGTGGIVLVGCYIQIIESPVPPICINSRVTPTFVGTTPQAYWDKDGLLKTPAVVIDDLRNGRWVQWTGRLTAFGAAATTGYVSLGTAAMDGLIEISITDTYANANASGVLTKQFAVIRAATAAPIQSSRISESVGNVPAVFNVGDLELDGTNLRIPINWISGTEGCTVCVRALFATEASVTSLLASLACVNPTGSAAAAAVQYVSWPYMQDVSAVSGAVWKCPADATDPTGGGGAAAGRIPINIGGATKYIPYY